MEAICRIDHLVEQELKEIQGLISLFYNNPSQVESHENYTDGCPHHGLIPVRSSTMLLAHEPSGTHSNCIIRLQSMYQRRDDFIQPVKLAVYEVNAISEGYVLAVLSHDRSIPRLKWISETMDYTMPHVCYDFFLHIQICD